MNGETSTKSFLETLPIVIVCNRLKSIVIDREKTLTPISSRTEIFPESQVFLVLIFARQRWNCSSAFGFLVMSFFYLVQAKRKGKTIWQNGRLHIPWKVLTRSLRTLFWQHFPNWQQNGVCPSKSIQPISNTTGTQAFSTSPLEEIVVKWGIAALPSGCTRLEESSSLQRSTGKWLTARRSNLFQLLVNGPGWKSVKF